MKRNNTKRTLVLSLISILLCFTMLIGSTFAWFTDTASTAVSTIQSGTLDIVLEYQDDDDWKNAEGETLAWNRACENGTGLWEPGCTYSLPAIRVRNNGNLSLKYKIYINGIRGDAKLNEAIDWTIKIGGDDFPLEGFEGVLLPEGVTGHDDDNNTLPSGSTGSLVISGHMREEAGNEYQGLTIDGIGITVVATQYNWECDSYGHDYDKDAKYPSCCIDEKSYPDLATAIEAAKEGETIKLLEGAIDEPLVLANQSIDIKNITIDGNGFSAPGVTMDTVWEDQVIIENLTVKNLTVTEPFNLWDYSAGYPKVNGLTFEGCTFDLSTSVDSNNFGISIGTKESRDEILQNVTIRNCTFKGTRRGINLYRTRNLLVENCVFESCKEAAINIDDVFGSFTVKDNVIRNSKKAVSINTVANSNNATDYAANVVITGNVMTNMTGQKGYRSDSGHYYVFLTSYDRGDTNGQSTYTITDNYYGGAEGVTIEPAFIIRFRIVRIDDTAPRSTAE